MKKFIEVSTENGKFLVNVNTISCLYTIKDGRTRITSLLTLKNLTKKLRL